MAIHSRLFAVFLMLGASASASGANEGTGVRALPVPASDIAAGQVIKSTDLTERRFHTTSRSLSGIATNSSEIEGKEARRKLQAGKPIPLSSLTRPISVRRGMKVAASYEEAGLFISTQLVALEDGGKGDIISLRNAATGAVVSAEIRDDGAIAVRGE